MAHDAQMQSLSEHDQSLERQVRDLNLIVNHLLNRLDETRGNVESNGARLDRCAALAESAAARAEAAIGKAQEAVHAEALLRQVAEAAGDGPRHAQPKPRRDRHGLRLVTAFTLLAGALTWLRSAALATTARKAATVGISLAAAGGIAVAPSLQGPPAVHGVHAARDFDGRHHKGLDIDRPPVTPPRQHAPAARRRRRHADAATGAGAGAGPDLDNAPVPSPDPSPSPSPSPTVSPSPSPSIGSYVASLPTAPGQWEY